MVTRWIARLTAAHLLGIAAITFAGTAARATGNYIPELRFFSRSGMDPSDNLAYFHGRLGILRGTFDDNRLFAAYRQLLGGTFTDAQAQQILAPCCDARGPNDDAGETWSIVRKRVNVATLPNSYSPSRPERPPETAALDVQCFPNAFRNAAAVLIDRIKQHGADDPSVRDWAVGQDAVFDNCTTDGRLPSAAPADSPDWLKADRAYQIASAYFYRNDYAHAAELYAAIGQDASSSWRKVGRYLAARAAVHAAIVAPTSESIAAAKAAIAGITADPDLADYQADAPRLAALVEYGTEPRQRAQELATALLAPDLASTLAADLHDFVSLERTGKRYTDAGAWIYDVDALPLDKSKSDGARADALSRWHAGHALPWLVAAMMALAPDDPDAAEAIAASRAVDAGSPAYYTLAWHRVRLLIGQRKTDDARSELDRLLAAASLPEGVGNLLRYQRLAVARDVGEFARFAVRHGEFLMYLYNPRTNLGAYALPLPGTKWDDDIARIIAWRTELFQKDPPYLDADGAYGMTSFMPLPMMAQVVSTAGLPANIKRDLALAVWTRAVLLDDAATGRQMAEILASFFPQYADGWNGYRGAASAATRKVEAALLLLKLPAARPYPDSGLGYIYKRDVIGLFGPRWWATDDKPYSADDNGDPQLCDGCAMPFALLAPPFITDANRAAAQADNDRLAKLPGAPQWLGSVIIPWAKAHLSDPRVPEALHNVVRATQYGDMDSETSEAAYNLLHNRFPRNPWTAKTPLWF